jgi:hypothetical protein
VAQSRICGQKALGTVTTATTAIEAPAAKMGKKVHEWQGVPIEKRPKGEK